MGHSCSGISNTLILHVEGLPILIPLKTITSAGHFKPIFVGLSTFTVPKSGIRPAFPYSARLHVCVLRRILCLSRWKVQFGRTRLTTAVINTKSITSLGTFLKQSVQLFIIAVIGQFGLAHGSQSRLILMDLN